MQTLRDIHELRRAVAALRAGGRKIALVPTMGALHAGHLALVEQAQGLADAVIVSIFVNPLQFNDPNDLAAYPRTLEEDLAQLGAARCDLVWLPQPGDLYPDGFSTTVSVAGVSERWEGEHRPGHFDGVATIVAKLFAAATPDVAIFGEKDFQQLAVIRRLNADLDFGIEILAAPIVRDGDGLALSSRNARLSLEDRARAVALPRTLDEAAAALADGVAADPLLAGARTGLIDAGFEGVDYLALVDEASLAPLASASATSRLIAAATIGGVRLIDTRPAPLRQTG